MSGKLKIIDIGIAATGVLIPDGYEVLTVFPGHSVEGAYVHKIILVSKEDDVRSGAESQERAGLA